MKQLYFRKLGDLLGRIESEQGESIDRAAELISNAVAKGDCIHIYDTGHMLDSELIHRAGGLNCFKRLAFALTVDNDVRKRTKDMDKNRNLEGVVRYALNASNVHPGDVLFIGSVSGKSVLPVDLAIHARELGVTVIVITSVAYSSIVQSEHSSGKRLFEVADLVIDNCAPSQDGMIELSQMEVSMCPASGIAAAVIMWAIEAKTVELLLNKGIKPTILKSVNYPGGLEYNDTEFRRYEETGY
ncbi:sugar isomerase domain-containing protein [Paenibacillus eucommiae]|uniref:Phosphosugar-binding protein n=1 Tax=Paenibacillus eucommiae TaxID=1355755 RepID=A0ABS4IT41_9BACL|nr:sugar isomerase domain-containing protein [Paenibacillus eucommiae]MBP1990735.1 putative phosphosugar-binding protein [Paenibacillus eucommiae]